VHFAVDDRTSVRPGDIVTSTITEAAPHHLIADAGVASVRRTRAGDAHQAGTTPTTAPVGVGLGMPMIGASPIIETASACGTGGCA
jgi:tRNA-2-methylthio-N6-dimethylallyladenosine synthase